MLTLEETDTKKIDDTPANIYKLNLIIEDPRSLTIERLQPYLN